MTRFDDMLIGGLFAPLAGWLEDRLGVGHWRVSLECLNGHIACYLAGTAFAIAGKGMRDGIFADLLAAALWLGIMEMLRRAALRQAASSLGVQTARLGEWHFRAILLVMLPLSFCYADGWPGAFYAGSLALLLGHLYFKACDALPPPRKRALAFHSA